MKSKYDAATLAVAVAASRSYAAALRALGLKVTGGSQAHIKRLVGQYGIDTSHFLGQGYLKHGSPPGGIPKLSPVQLLVRDRRSGARERADRLRRALIESGVEPRCFECSSGEEWNGKPLRMQIDHRNGDPIDNRLVNLRFLCPNCHSQTETFGTRNRRRS